jgi:hypothetical protein
MIRLELPAHLRTLAQVDGEVKINVENAATQGSVFDALEACYPNRGVCRRSGGQHRCDFMHHRNAMSYAC